MPAQAPLGAEVDFADLARRYPLAGGSIRNIALAAAVLAAGQGVPIGMSCLSQAARREYQKLGKTFPDAGYFTLGARP
jgi:hypothetical protein